MLIFDSTPLVHFARADRLVVLDQISVPYGGCRVARAVLDEVARGAASFPKLSDVLGLDWLTPVDCDGLAELQAFARYSLVLGSGERDIGEAITLAWAEVHNGTAIVDERAGAREGRARGVDVHGSLWLIAEGHRTELLSKDEAEDLVDQLAAHGQWLPCSGSEFVGWAIDQGPL